MKIPSTCILRLSTLFLLCTLENSPDATRAPQQKCQHATPLSYYSHNGSIRLYQSSDTRECILLCTEGLQTPMEMPLRICTSSLPGAAYIFHRRWACHYLKGDFPAGSRTETSRAGSSGGVRGQYGSLGALLCLQLEGKWHPGRHPLGLIDLVVRAARGRLQLLTTTEKAVKTALCAGVSEAHTHTHTHTHTPLWVMRSSVQVWRKTSEAESTSEKTHRAETHRGGSVRTWEGNKRGRRSAQWHFLMFSSHINTNQSIRNKALMETLHCTSLQISWLEGGNH